MGTARNGGIEIVYENFGSNLDPPLILLHGLGSSMLVWHEDLCGGFADRGFFVLRMDHRDSGLSTVLPDGARYTLEDMAGDAMAVLDDAGCERAVVCGYSLGGMVAQAAAVAFANRVAGLVSISSHTGEPGVGDPTPEALAALTAPPAATTPIAAPSSPTIMPITAPNRPTMIPAKPPKPAAIDSTIVNSVSENV